MRKFTARANGHRRAAVEARNGAIEADLLDLVVLFKLLQEPIGNPARVALNQAELSSFLSKEPDDVGGIRVVRELDDHI